MLAVCKQKQYEVLKRDTRHISGEHRLMLKKDENETSTYTVTVILRVVMVTDSNLYKQ